MAALRPGIREIAPGLSQGALAHVVRDWATEVHGHFDCVLLMAEEVEQIPRYQGGPGVVLLPIADNADGLPSSELHFVMGFIAAMSAIFPRILTVCHMGENRSGLASCCILHCRDNMTGDAAADLVQQNGPLNSPTQETSFWNPGFNRQIRGLGASGD